jgi:hypothetical protein
LQEKIFLNYTATFDHYTDASNRASPRTWQMNSLFEFFNKKEETSNNLVNQLLKNKNMLKLPSKLVLSMLDKNSVFVRVSRFPPLRPMHVDLA